MANARNFPNRLREKSERCNHESSAGKTFSSGMRMSNTKPVSQKASPSVCCARGCVWSFSVMRIHPGLGVRVAALDGKESGGAPLQKENHQHKDTHLAVNSPQTRLEQLVQSSDAERSDDCPCQFAHTSGHDYHERIHDVVLAESGLDIADERQGPTGNAGKAGPEGERIGVDFSCRNAEAGAHVAILHHGTNAQTEAGSK